MSSPLFLQKLYSLHLDNAELPCQYCCNHHLFFLLKLPSIFTTFDKACCDWCFDDVGVLVGNLVVVFIVAIRSEASFFFLVSGLLHLYISSEIDSFLPPSQPDLFNSHTCFLMIHFILFPSLIIVRCLQFSFSPLIIFSFCTNISWRFNSFLANAPIFILPEITRKQKGFFWCFQGVKNGNMCQKCINFILCLKYKNSYTNPFHATGLSIHPLKVSENLVFLIISGALGRMSDIWLQHDIGKIILCAMENFQSYTCHPWLNSKIQWLGYFNLDLKWPRESKYHCKFETNCACLLRLEKPVNIPDQINLFIVSFMVSTLPLKFCLPLIERTPSPSSKKIYLLLVHSSIFLEQKFLFVDFLIYIYIIYYKSNILERLFWGIIFWHPYHSDGT